MQRLLAVLLALLSVGLLSCMTNEEVARKLQPDDVEEAISLIDDGQYEEAIAILDAFIEDHPDSTIAYSERSYAYGRIGEFDRALADADKAIQLSPEEGRLYGNRGGAYVDLGQPERALEDYNRAVELAPDHALAYSERGYAFGVLGQLDRSLQDYDQALLLDADLDVAHNNRAALYQELNGLSLNDALDQEIASSPQTALPYVKRGIARANGGDFEGSVADLSEGLRFEPDNLLGRLQMAAVLTATGDLNGALDNADRAAELAPVDVLALAIRAVIHYQLGNDEAGDEDGEAAISMARPPAMKEQIRQFVEQGRR